ncbi:MAG: GntR family transcriptional regulator [Candidatus Latescibacterota bacterium]
MRDQTNNIYQELRNQILDGTLKPREHLQELSLAEAFNVSRPTVKKALLKLASENLVVIEENKRAKVRWFTVEEVIQCLEVRELLECFIIQQSGKLLSAADLEEMSIALNEVKRALDEQQFLKYAEHIPHYYDVLYRACLNRPVVEIIKIIKNQLKRYNIMTFLIPGRGENTFKDHKEILSALKCGDVDGAEALMRAHISNLRMLIRMHAKLFM